MPGKPTRTALSLPLLEALARHAREVGLDPRMVQGGGGNVSVKDSRHMAVKASGKRLGTLCADTGFATVEFKPLMHQVQELASTSAPPTAETMTLLDSAFLGLTPCPSIEVWLHAVVGTAAVHLHPNAVLNLVCQRDWERLLKEHLRRAPIECPVVFVPYATPGLPLAIRLLTEIRKLGGNAPPSTLVAFLQNHGILTAADSIPKAFQLATSVAESLDRRFLHVGQPAVSQRPEVPPTLVRTLAEALEAFSTTPRTCSFWGGQAAFKLLQLVRHNTNLARQVYFPDQAVYCGPELLYLEGDAPADWQGAWDAFQAQWCMEPAVVIHSAGLVGLRTPAGQSNLARIQVLESLAELLLHGAEHLHPLSRSQVLDLVGWDRERCRQNAPG